MDIKVFCPLWGHENVKTVDFLHRVRVAGFDGLECPLPVDTSAKRLLLDTLAANELLFIAQQVHASGEDFADYKKSFLKYLHNSLDGKPILINSHTGRDYYTFEQNLELIDIAAEFEAKTGVKVAHEIHRGRFTYSPGNTRPYMEARKELTVTADFSHWVCVTESYLEHFESTLEMSIQRAIHVHARVGFTEGPQVPDPSAPEWQDALNRHMEWWKRIVQARQAAQAPLFTVTAEFGPPPYMPTIPFTNKPVADQFEVNRYMKDQVRLQLA